VVPRSGNGNLPRPLLNSMSLSWLPWDHSQTRLDPKAATDVAVSRSCPPPWMHPLLDGCQLRHKEETLAILCTYAFIIDPIPHVFGDYYFA
jgi:hypothetical protein